MFNSKEKMISVEKAELIAKLKENRETHVAEYSEMAQNYQAAVIKELKKMIKEAQAGTIRTSVKLDRPVDHTEDYDIIIGMLEMSTADIVEISQSEYCNYVLNKWDWSNSFDMHKTVYMSKN